MKRTVEELETAGVGGTEHRGHRAADAVRHDQAAPQTIAEGVGKMRAALAGRQDPLLVIAGRTSAIQITGLDDAIARGKAYEAAGVDALFLVGIKTRAELDAIRPPRPCRSSWAACRPSSPTSDYLSARRVRIALQGHRPFAAAVKATYETLKALREGVQPGKLQGVADAELISGSRARRTTRGWTKEFLGG